MPFVAARLPGECHRLQTQKSSPIRPDGRIGELAFRMSFSEPSPLHIHSVIDVYAVFELFLITLPTHMLKKHYPFQRLEAFFSPYRRRESCHFAAKNSGTIFSASTPESFRPTQFLVAVSSL
jgi:hypothetical protein